MKQEPSRSHAGKRRDRRESPAFRPGWMSRPASQRRCSSPYTDTGELVLEEDTGVSGAYYLLTKQEPVFFVAYWPSRLSRSRLALPPPALGELRGDEPCRWDLRPCSRWPPGTARIACGPPRPPC